MINQATGPEANVLFSQTRPCFIQNYTMNLMNIKNVNIYLHQGLGFRNKFWTISVKMHYQATSPEPMWNVQHVYDEHNM